VALFWLPLFLFDDFAEAAPAPSSSYPRVEKATHKGYTEKIPDSTVSFDLVPIPGGTFLMGSPTLERGRRPDEGPQHPVQVRPFWMARMEITWDIYDLYCQGLPPSEAGNDAVRDADADAITRPTLPYPDETRGFGRKGYPVIGLSHHAAMEFCRWLSHQTGKAYRLPTEAEWEWACRAGTGSPYFFGHNARTLDEYAWYSANAGESTHPVGKKKPNPWGLYDIYGNVGEWCIDHYQKDRYARLSRAHPTLGPVLLPSTARFAHVVRGGSWDAPASQCRSAARLASEPRWNGIDPDRPKSLWWLWNADYVGFRVVRAVEEQAHLKGIKSGVTKKSK
jgi:formylglycine-generating enzyme required for sulfatase activity